MGEKGLRAWEKRRRKVDVFVTGFSSSYLSISPRFLIPKPSSPPPPPKFSSRSLTLSLIISPSFFYHLFSLPLTSIPPSPPLITHPPTHQQNPAPHSTLTFPPIVLSTIFPPPPQYSSQERPMRLTEHCAKADKKTKRESKQGPPETQL